MCDLMQKTFIGCLQMRQLDHVNLNKFFGISLDAPNALFSIWRYCERGTLAVANFNFTRINFKCLLEYN